MRNNTPEANKDLLVDTGSVLGTGRKAKISKA